MTTARRRRRRARGLAALVATALALPLGACGGDDDPEEEATTTTSSTEAPSTTAPPSPEDEVEAAYLAYWDMAARLSANPDPDDPEIAQRAVDPVLGEVTDTLSTLRAQGQGLVSRDQSTHEIRDVGLEEGRASVEACSVDDSALVDLATQEVLEERVTTSLIETRLVRDGSGWRVSEVDPVRSWDGAVECPQ